MTTNKNIGKCLWISVVMFVTYLLLGSFVVSKNILELAYLIILYAFLGVAKFKAKEK